MALDEAFRYWRELEGGVKPTLLKLADALQTIDMAMEPAFRDGTPGPLIVTAEHWSRIRNSLFQVLITNFAGYFLIVDTYDSEPIVPGADWPEEGKLEFYPEGINRKSDAFRCELSSLHPELLTRLRWMFGNGQQNLAPSTLSDIVNEIDQSEECEVNRVLDRFYEICEEEAAKGRRKAEEHWWKLYCETQSATSTGDQREMRRLLNYLEAVWGCGRSTELTSRD